MFELSDLKKTRVYQQAFEEGKLKGKTEGQRIGKLQAVPPMLAVGLTVEQIAQALGLTVDEVRQASIEKYND